MKLAVTGAGGFLGARILSYYENKKNSGICHEVVGYTRADMDITRREQVLAVLEKDHPDFLIHTAAVSDIGECEKNPEQADRVNVEAVKNLADACGSLQIPMIFCSSDQVYMGSPEREPHRETEKNLNPPTRYGRQKLQSEKYLLESSCRAVILRLSWMYASDIRCGLEHGNLLTSLAQAVKEQTAVQYPIYDFRSLTSVWDVVENLEKMFEAEPGIYNFGSENKLSTCEAVRLLLRGKRAEHLLEENRIAFAENPRNLCMNMEKTRGAGVKFPTTEEAFGKLIF